MTYRQLLTAIERATELARDTGRYRERAVKAHNQEYRDKALKWADETEAELDIEIVW